ncbi:FGFR4 [Branchiostoma lanceolatum]|uniref:FGFR4 protein n=1 Tax=Branchiostoma lanceolatum TaxID=7740 RepID=A0A8K0F0D3_BRALA|nr:FGFR4 [Branchiostoma lanceolatum]
MRANRATCGAAAAGVLGLLWVVTAAVTCPEECDCGSDRRVNCDGRGLNDVPANIPLGTTLLHLNNNNIQNLSDADFSYLSSLEELRLNNNNIRVLPVGVFSNLKNLGWLDLRDNDIRDLPVGVFFNLTSLEGLFLSDNNIRVLPAGVFSQLISLEELHLRNNDIRDLPGGVFSNLTSLERLYLSDNNISVLPAKAFSRLTRLKRLDLSNNDLADLPDGVFSNLTSLERLYLSNNNIWSLPTEVLSHLARLQTLEFLRIAGNPWRCDCSLHGLMTSARLRALVVDGPTCSSPPHMEGDALTTVEAGAVCRGRGDCTTGSAGGACTCNVRWTGPFCDIEANLALGKNATQSSIFIGDPSYGAARAVDGSTNGCAVTDAEHQPWWKVDLAGNYTVSRVIFVFDFDSDFGDIFTVRVGPNDDFTQNGQCGHRQDTVVTCDPPMFGRYVSVQVTSPGDADTTIRLSLCEVKVYVSGICCNNTIRIMNGHITADDGYCSGNAVQFSCDTGYELVGSSFAVCQNRRWDREIPTCSQRSATSIGAIIGGTSAGIALFVAAVVFMVLRRRRRRRRRKREDSPQSDDTLVHRRRLAEMVPLVPPRPQFPKLEVDPSRVTLGERIGSGAFGLVYRATLTRDDETEDVVVKTVKESASEEDKLCFLEEIRSIVELGVHKNLLGLVNCCTVVRDHLYLITEFMPYGDLKSFLRKCREEETSDEPRDEIFNFEVIQMYQVARQIARGMDHIARSRYVHGDLAARNVLVGEDLKVKISDFGLAEDIYSRGYRRQDRLQKIPWKWMAPERLEGGEAYTSQSDVWSFGIVLYEICTLGGDPYPGVAVADMKERLKSGNRMRRPEDCPQAMYDLMLQCWQWKPAERPSFRSLEAKLDKNLAFYGPEYATTG